MIELNIDYTYLAPFQDIWLYHTSLNGWKGCPYCKKVTDGQTLPNGFWCKKCEKSYYYWSFTQFSDLPQRYEDWDIFLVRGNML